MIGTLLTLLSNFTSIIDTIRKNISDIKSGKSVKKEKELSEIKSFLREISELIDMFTKTVDVIFEIINDKKIERNVFSNIHKLNSANRKLFEISSEMKIIMYSVKSRFSFVELEQIELITDRTLQIVLSEDFIGTRLVDEKNKYLLPLDAEIENKAIIANVNNYKDPPIEIRHKTFDMDSIGWLEDYVAEDYNAIILSLHKSKEDIAKILYSFE